MYDGDPPPETCPSCGETFWLDWVEARSALGAPVSRFMRRTVVVIDGNATASEAARLMKEKQVGSVIVTVRGDPIGIVTERDMLYKVVADDLPASRVPIHKVMSSPVVSVPSDTPVRKALDLMDQRGFRRLLVTEGSKAVGLLSYRSILTEALHGAVAPIPHPGPAD